MTDSRICENFQQVSASLGDTISASPAVFLWWAVFWQLETAEGKTSLLRLPPWNPILPLFVNMESTARIVVASGPNSAHLIDCTLLEGSLSKRDDKCTREYSLRCGPNLSVI